MVYFYRKMVIVNDRMVDLLHQPYNASAMPVTGVAIDYPSGHRVAPHHHPRAQLAYAIEGVLVVETPSGRWVTPPTRGVWLPAGTRHALYMRGVTRLRSLFVTPDAIEGLPRDECVIDVSPLLRELILAATQVEEPYVGDSRDARLMRFLLDELCTLPVLPFHLPWPEDARIAQICRILTERPSTSLTADEWARRLAMSPKTFHRRFQRSTGVTFGRWRQQARLLLSLESLAQGVPIVEIALQQGYSSQSAFTAAFRRQFGVPPTAFYRNSGPAG
ncbi:AraC family transcriptional regulator [Halomonas sp. NCCP-2165]|nr:helix-turn-helix transcriptional regulator [Halomonas sp. NCCP-2165]